MAVVQEHFARERWLSESSLTTHGHADLLGLIAKKIKQNEILQERSFVLLDLDSTLYEVGPRNVQILKRVTEALDVPPQVKQAMQGLSSEKVGYSLKDTWRNLNLCLEDRDLTLARERIENEWRKAFFSNAYLQHDVAYTGVLPFAQTLYELGAELVYLTGRDAPAMEAGTIDCLRRDGFPLGHRTHLRMKSHRSIDDVEHKRGAALELAEKGTVVASLENEPRNFAALFQTFPQAIHVFVDTICSDKPAPAVQGAYRLRHQND